MRSEFQLAANAPEGPFGLEVLLNVRTGAHCFLSPEPAYIGELPAPPVTNAFMVWIGFPILSVSQGVQRSDVATVAARLRQGLEAPELPVCFAMGRDEQRVHVVVSDNPASRPRRELARAEVYVLSQMAWEEAEQVVVEIDGERHELRLTMVPVGDGTYGPLVE